MSIKLISFDLQGTLSDHTFSSEVWLDHLHQEFELVRQRSGEHEYQTIVREFSSTGEDDLRYYDIDYWLRRAGSRENCRSLIAKAEVPPQLFQEMKELVEELSGQFRVIVISATTGIFIEHELGEWKPFSSVYSSCDDYGIAGKPQGIFRTIAEQEGLSPEECLHTGDHKQMDGINPARAGWHSIYRPSEASAVERAVSVRTYPGLFKT